jgi:ATP-dependent DNA ligase
MFPEVVLAVWEHLPKRTIVDGEIVRWSQSGRLDFGALQRRVGGGRQARHLSIAEPCHYVIFDVLEIDGVDIRAQPLCERRKHLEDLFAHIPPACPLALSMQTEDPVEARLWFASLTAHGIEGLVIKAAGEPYKPGARSWWKYKSRTTTEAIIGGVTGTLARPSGLLLGRYPSKGGRLRVAGRTTRLHRDLAAEVATYLRPAAADHPWPEQLPAGWASGLYGKGDPVAYRRVVPELVVEVLVDVAHERGRWRHPLRYLRLRLDLSPDAVPRGSRLDAGSEGAYRQG